MTSARRWARPPSLPSGREWRRETRDIWTRFWRSPAARWVDRDADWGLLLRWIQTVDERWRLAEVVAAAPVVRDERHGVRPNPLAERLAELDAAISRMEQELGLTPRARRGVRGAGVPAASVDVDGGVEAIEAELNRLVLGGEG